MSYLVGRNTLHRDCSWANRRRDLLLLRLLPELLRCLGGVGQHQRCRRLKLLLHGHHLGDRRWGLRESLLRGKGGGCR